MTVQDTTPSVTFIGTGAQLSFPFTFRCDDIGWLSVDYVVNFDEFIINADQDNNPGGTVEYTVAPPLLQELTVIRNTFNTQELDYTRYDPFDSESHEDALDKLTMQIQDLQYFVTSILTQDFDLLGNVDFSTKVDGSMIFWDDGAGLWRDTAAAMTFDPGGVGPFFVNVNAEFQQQIDSLNLLRMRTGTLASWYDVTNIRNTSQYQLGNDFLLQSDGVTNEYQISGFTAVRPTYNATGMALLTDIPVVPPMPGGVLPVGTVLGQSLIWDGAANWIVDADVIHITSSGNSGFVLVPTSGFTSQITAGADTLSLEGGIGAPFPEMEYFAQRHTFNTSAGASVFQIDTFTSQTRAFGLFRLDRIILGGGVAQFQEGVSRGFASTAGFGYFWVRDDVPNTPMFTDDTDVDYVLNASGVTDHTLLTNIGVNTHVQIDTHIADATIHFTEASIDHTLIANIGTNSHVAIDSHIGTANIHFVDAPADGNTYGRNNNAWALAGAGDVVGPGSAVDNRLAVFDGVTGKLIKDGSTITAIGNTFLATGLFTLESATEVFIVRSGSESVLETTASTDGGVTVNNARTGLLTERVFTVADRSAWSESWQYDDINQNTTITPLLRNFKTDNLTPSLVTEIAVHDSSRAFQDFGNFWGAELAVGDRFTAKQTNDNTRYILFEVSSALIDAGGFWRIPVSVISSGVNFADGASVHFEFASVNTLPAGGGASTLQDAYDGSAGVPQIVLAAAQPFTLRDNAAPIGDVFVLEDTAGVDFFNVDPLQIEFGVATQRLFVATNVVAGYGGIEFYPDDFTRTVTGQPIFSWTSTLTSSIPGGGGIGNETAPNFVNWAGEVILTEQGNLFNTQSLFAQSTIITCEGANTGPIYTMINQPRLRTGPAGGSRTGSQQNAVRSQLQLGPNIAGNFTLTSHETYFATVIANATVGTVSCTTVNYFAPKAPTLTAGATIGTLHCLDLPNIPAGGITTLHGISSAMDSGIMLLHSGTAPIEFTNAAFRMDFIDNAAIRFGTGDDVLLRWDGSSFDIQFQQFSDVLAINNPVNAQILFDIGANEYTFNTTRGFTIGAQTGTLGNSFGNFVFGAMTTPIAGEFSQFLLTQAGNLTVDQAGMNIFGWTINSPSMTLSGPGTVLTAAVLNVGGNPNQGSLNRAGIRILSNPSGGSGVNAALWLTAGRARFDGPVDINAPIALGGGAGATLGTIGATGPTVAGQNEWAQIEVNGNVRWVPVWA